jgi:hypothetical protein
VRFPRDCRESGESDECPVVTPLEGPQTEAPRIETGFELIDQRIAFETRQRRRKVLHDAWIGVHRGERRAIVVAPVA